MSHLCTVIPYHDGLRALKFFLDKRPVQEPSTSVLVRLAEFVLTLNNISFDGEHYQQISGVAMGTKMGPNYANLFVGFVEKQIFEQYTDPTPDYLGRYIDDCVGIALTMLIISIQHSSSHGRSARPVYHS